MLKLSDIEKAVTKKLIIVDGVPQWSDKINGEIVFNDITNELVEMINKNIIQNLNGNETEEEFIYSMLPYLAQIENDIDIDRFTTLLQRKNSIIIMLYEGVMKIVNDLFDYAESIGRVKKQEEELKNRLPQESTEQKILRLTKEMENEKDIKKKKVLLLELAKLYEEVEKNG